MLHLTLTRTETSDEGTFGVLEGEALYMYTGELPWKQNARNISCIPAGRYLCKPHISPKFGKCFWLQDVPGRSEILIHPANYMGDVEAGWKTHLAGCIATGFSHSEDSRGQDMVLRSKEAVGKLIEYTDFQEFLLKITW